jgi:erythritol transport system ATP-binding protein
MLLASLKKYLNRFFLVKKKEQSAVESMIHDLSVRVASAQQSITALSGGNQQKVVLARGMMSRPRVLLVDDPTRGVDVGAKFEILETLGRLAREGLGVVFATSDLTEVLSVATRVLVMARGHVVADLAAGEATADALAAAASSSPQLAGGARG